MRIGAGIVRWLALGLALAAACRSSDSAELAATARPASGVRLPLQPLDERVAVELRRAFDGAVDRTRFIVGLSPT